MTTVLVTVGIRLNLFAQRADDRHNIAVSLVISVDYKAVKTDGNFALVMGNEGQGISQEMAESADQLVHISMPGQAESLNVAVAAGILMFSL